MEEIIINVANTSSEPVQIFEVSGADRKIVKIDVLSKWIQPKEESMALKVRLNLDNFFHPLRDSNS